MKHTFILLIVALITTLFTLGGCSKESAPQSLVDTQNEDMSTIEETQENDKINVAEKVVEISDELIEEMEIFFQEFLKAYIEGDEETFKTYMSDEFHNDYLEFQDNPTNYYSSTFHLNMVVDDRLMSWSVHTGNNPNIHAPGITFATRLMTQNDVDTDYDLGSKFLVNISRDDNNNFFVNWIAFGIA